ncbi:MAG: adenosylmethionine--8-amino-7-oxononanoate transaminase [Proteobacteria bacterium]|nr:adenosylmethionine--8-amino-7-oxononanoate transaminase [Pseudomonadota bacterium]
MSNREWPDWAEAGYPHIWLPYAQMQTQPLPEAVLSAKGVRITLADGRELVDGTSSWWTACHGYSHPYIAEKVTEQLNRMPHIMLGGFVHEPVLRLAKRLADLLPGDLNHVFFSESGSVSVEIAMKMAVQFWRNRGERQRIKFISFRNGYHGDTIAAMSVCDPDDGMHTMFKGLQPEQFVVGLPQDDAGFADFETFLEAGAHRVAAVILEPLVQAAGGMKFHSPKTLKMIAEACRRHDVLLILDEIATGFGRTGTLFACEQAGVTPDIITLSKALTGGTMALAATVAADRVYEAFLSDDADKALMHGPTYTGNPLACAAANASLDLFEHEDRLSQVAAIEEQLTAELAACSALSGVTDVRVKGAIGVVQLTKTPDLDAMRQRFVQAGVWVRPFGDFVYLMPPLVIDAEDLTILTRAVHEVLAEWSAGV